MSNRKYYAILGAFLLFFGGLLYVIFRENTYIAQIFKEIVFLETLQKHALPVNSGFIRYYLQDFLWALSLNLELFAILQPNLKNAILCCTITLAYGIIWEILQNLYIITGTGDFCDVLMYLLAVIFALSIFIKKEKIK